MEKPAAAEIPGLHHQLAGAAGGQGVLAGTLAMKSRRRLALMQKEVVTVAEEEKLKTAFHLFAGNEFLSAGGGARGAAQGGGLSEEIGSGGRL